MWLLHWLRVVTERLRSRIQLGFLYRVAGLRLRDKVRALDIREGLSRTATPPYQEEPDEMVQAFGQDATRHLSGEVFRGCPVER